MRVPCRARRLIPSDGRSISACIGGLVAVVAGLITGVARLPGLLERAGLYVCRLCACTIGVEGIRSVVKPRCSAVGRGVRGGRGGGSRAVVPGGAPARPSACGCRRVACIIPRGACTRTRCASHALRFIGGGRADCACGRCVPCRIAIGWSGVIARAHVVARSTGCRGSACIGHAGACGWGIGAGIRIYAGQVVRRRLIAAGRWWSEPPCRGLLAGPVLLVSPVLLVVLLASRALLRGIGWLSCGARRIICAVVIALLGAYTACAIRRCGGGRIGLAGTLAVRSAVVETCGLARIRLAGSVLRIGANCGSGGILGIRPSLHRLRRGLGARELRSRVCVGGGGSRRSAVRRITIPAQARPAHSTALAACQRQCRDKQYRPTQHDGSHEILRPVMELHQGGGRRYEDAAAPVFFPDDGIQTARPSAPVLHRTTLLAISGCIGRSGIKPYTRRKLCQIRVFARIGPSIGQQAADYRLSRNQVNANCSLNGRQPTTLAVSNRATRWKEGTRTNNVGPR